MSSFSDIINWKRTTTIDSLKKKELKMFSFALSLSLHPAHFPLFEGKKRKKEKTASERKNDDDSSKVNM